MDQGSHLGIGLSFMLRDLYEPAVAFSYVGIGIAEARLVGDYATPRLSF